MIDGGVDEVDENALAAPSGFQPVAPVAEMCEENIERREGRTLVGVLKNIGPTRMALMAIIQAVYLLGWGSSSQTFVSFPVGRRARQYSGCVGLGWREFKIQILDLAENFKILNFSCL